MASESVSHNPQQGYSCTFTEVDQLPTSTDPSQDFSASNIQETMMVKNSTCAGVSSGTLTNQAVSNIARSGNNIVINSGQDGIVISGAQATIPAVDLQQCGSGVQASGTLQKVELDTITNQIRVFIAWTLVKNGCTQATPTSGQSNSAPVVIDSFSPPSSLTSLPNYLYVVVDPGLNGSIQQASYTSSDSTFGVSTNGTGVPQLNVYQNPTSQWTITFQVPGQVSQPAPGTYTATGGATGNAQQTGFSLSGQIVNGGTAIRGNGGSFQILNATYDSSGNLLTLKAAFSETSDQTGGSFVRGVISYNATVDLSSYQPPADTTSPYLFYLKGNLGTGVTSPISVNQTQAVFTGMGQNAPGATVYVENTSLGSNNNWIAKFTFPSGVSPQPGCYGDLPNATPPASGSQQASLSIHTWNGSLEGYSCSATSGVISGFCVTNAQFDSNGVLTSFAANFVQNCGKVSPVSGTVRFNQPQSSLPAYVGPTDLTSLNLVHIESVPGDPVGGGQTWDGTDAQGTFNISPLGASGVTVSFNSTDGLHSWIMSFNEAGESQVVPGTFSTSGGSSLTIFGRFSACATNQGQFQVIKASYDSNGRVSAFEATFTQNCSWNASPLRGTIRVGTLP